jgi:hypothetical protein
MSEPFCEVTGALLGNFVIFCHFFLFSLMGVAALLVCRRRGMAPDVLPPELEEAELKLKSIKDSSLERSQSRLEPAAVTSSVVEGPRGPDIWSPVRTSTVERKDFVAPIGKKKNRNKDGDSDEFDFYELQRDYY